jgi:hypothetical protein
MPRPDPCCTGFMRRRSPGTRDESRASRPLTRCRAAAIRTRGESFGRQPEGDSSLINGILWGLRCGTLCRPNTEAGTGFIGDFGAGARSGDWQVVSVTAAEINAPKAS